MTELTLPLAIENLTTIYNAVPEAQILESARWYETAKETTATIAEWARMNGYPTITENQIAALIAVSSPLKLWEQNVTLIIEFLLNGATGKKNNGKNVHWPIIVNKMIKITECADDSLIPAILQKGYKEGDEKIKTHCFYLNITGQDTSAVTVDAHIGGAAAGTYTLGYNKRGQVAVKYYQMIVTAIQTIAESVGQEACAVQAILWEAYKAAK